MQSLAVASGNRESDYNLLVSQTRQLWDPQLPRFSNLANISALIRSRMERVNWLGFYIWDERENRLILGPFQGSPACMIIPEGKGVCGTAVRLKKTQRVHDITVFPGHIACDSASRSELVVPIIHRGKIRAVIDIDSPEPDRFDETDQYYIEKIANLLGFLWTACGKKSANDD
ncbi:MAG TPA: GAF domain-containing protein [Spirochaetota bacterium]|nr:GAF domain-containing protein [Spirochaetota bacterium]